MICLLSTLRGESQIVGSSPFRSSNPTLNLFNQPVNQYHYFKINEYASKKLSRNLIYFVENVTISRKGLKVTRFHLQGILNKLVQNALILLHAMSLTRWHRNSSDSHDIILHIKWLKFFQNCFKTFSVLVKVMEINLSLTASKTIISCTKKCFILMLKFEHVFSQSPCIQKLFEHNFILCYYFCILRSYSCH